MNDADRSAIECVFSRIREVEQQGVPRDSDAERLIHQEMQRNPASAYYLAQTVLIQQDALRQAQERIQALESRSSAPATRPAAAIAANPAMAANRVPASSASLSANAFGRRPAAADSPSSNLSSAGFGRSNTGAGGGGFLAGALQTAMGVAGGMMLGNMLSGFFGGNEAQAGEVPPVEEDAAPEYDDEGGDFGGDDGGDW